MEKDDEQKMHRQVDWLRPSDRQIILEISRYGGWITPNTLYLNLPYTQQHVQERCRILSNRGLLKRFDEDTVAYRVTEFGQRFLDDEVTVEELRDR